MGCGMVMVIVRSPGGCATGWAVGRAMGCAMAGALAVVPAGRGAGVASLGSVVTSAWSLSVGHLLLCLQSAVK